ncbi:4982_t:CDS:1, partial [Cetraspora pellucida]
MNENKDSLETLFTTNEYEEQFSILELKFYTRYEDYLEAVKNEEPEIYDILKNWFSYFEAHVRSWAHIDTEGRKYVRNNFDQRLSNWRYTRYEEDFDET